MQRCRIVTCCGTCRLHSHRDKQIVATSHVADVYCRVTCSTMEALLVRDCSCKVRGLVSYVGDHAHEVLSQPRLSRCAAARFLLWHRQGAGWAVSMGLHRPVGRGAGSSCGAGRRASVQAPYATAAAARQRESWKAEAAAHSQLALLRGIAVRRLLALLQPKKVPYQRDISQASCSFSVAVSRRTRRLHANIRDAG